MTITPIIILGQQTAATVKIQTEKPKRPIYKQILAEAETEFAGDQEVLARITKFRVDLTKIGDEITKFRAWLRQDPARYQKFDKAFDAEVAKSCSRPRYTAYKVIVEAYVAAIDSLGQKAPYRMKKFKGWLVTKARPKIAGFRDWLKAKGKIAAYDKAWDVVVTRRCGWEEFKKPAISDVSPKTATQRDLVTVTLKGTFDFPKAPKDKLQIAIVRTDGKQTTLKPSGIIVAKDKQSLTFNMAVGDEKPGKIKVKVGSTNYPVELPDVTSQQEIEIKPFTHQIAVVSQIKADGTPQIVTIIETRAHNLASAQKILIPHYVDGEYKEELAIRPEMRSRDGSQLTFTIILPSDFAEDAGTAAHEIIRQDVAGATFVIYNLDVALQGANNAPIASALAHVEAATSREPLPGWRAWLGTYDTPGKFMLKANAGAEYSAETDQQQSSYRLGRNYAGLEIGGMARVFGDPGLIDLKFNETDANDDVELVVPFGAGFWKGFSGDHLVELEIGGGLRWTTAQEFQPGAYVLYRPSFLKTDYENTEQFNGTRQQLIGGGVASGRVGKENETNFTYALGDEMMRTSFQINDVSVLRGIYALNGEYEGHEDKTNIFFRLGVNNIGDAFSLNFMGRYLLYGSHPMAFGEAPDTYRAPLSAEALGISGLGGVGAKASLDVSKQVTAILSGEYGEQEMGTYQDKAYNTNIGIGVASSAGSYMLFLSQERYNYFDPNTDRYLMGSMVLPWLNESIAPNFTLGQVKTPASDWGKIGGVGSVGVMVDGMRIFEYFAHPEDYKVGQSRREATFQHRRGVDVTRISPRPSWDYFMSPVPLAWDKRSVDTPAPAPAPAPEPEAVGGSGGTGGTGGSTGASGSLGIQGALGQ
jgi:hypothetical protein